MQKSRQKRCLLHLASLALLRLHLVSFAPSLRLRSLFFALFGLPLASVAPPAWPKNIFTPSLEVPPGPAHSARTPPKARNGPLEDRPSVLSYFGSLFLRFGVVLGHHLGVIFVTFGGKVGLPSAICWKRLFFDGKQRAPL